MVSNKPSRGLQSGIGTVAIVAAAISMLTGCDIPSQGPDFSFNSSFSTPVIFEQSFVFLGADDATTQALIDTTRSGYDSLFAVDSENGAVFLVHNIETFKLDGLDDMIDPVEIEPQDVAVNMGDLATQDINTDFDQSIGVVEIAGISTPGMPPTVSGGAAYFPLAAGDFLTIPPTSFIDLSGADVDNVVITNESGTVNSLTFEITNRSTQPLTDGSGTAGTPPKVILETFDGQELMRSPFDRSPGNGETTTATVDLAGQTIPASSRFRFDVSTPAGFLVISSNPTSLEIHADMLPIRYDGFTLSNIPGSSVDASQSAVALESDINFTGITTRSGNVLLRIRNSLPIDVQLGDIAVLNDEDVDAYAAGHPVFTTPGRLVAAGASVDVPVQLGSTAVSASVSVDVVATGQPTSPSSYFQASDGIDIEVAGTLDVERLYFYPDGESFTSEGTIDFDASDVLFETSSDFVEFGAGALEMRQLLNGIDLTFDEVILSFPEIRKAPYGPSDSLVVRFRGTTDKAEQLQFAAIERNEPPRDLAIDLSGTRAYAIGNVIRYHVSATGESTSQQRMIEYTDEVSTSVRAMNLEVSALVGSVDPFSASLTTDSDGNGTIDPLVDSETIIEDLDGFGPLDDVTGFEFSGTELAINVTTSLSADLTIYGILIGEDGSGSSTFLQGRSSSAVAAGDSVISGFEIGGITASANQMFKISVAATGNSLQPSTQSVILDAENSNIDEFLSNLPSRMRFVGKAVIEAPSGRVELRQPVAMDISLGATIPLNVTNPFSLEKTLSADLSTIEGLTDPEATFTAERAALILDYTNGIPLGLDARLEFVDDLGRITTVLPADTGLPLRLEGATTSPDGFATQSTTSQIVLDVDDDTLRSLAQSKDVRLSIVFAASASTISRIRATDRIDMTLRGDFDINVSVGG